MRPEAVARRERQRAGANGRRTEGERKTNGRRKAAMRTVRTGEFDGGSVFIDGDWKPLSEANISRLDLVQSLFDAYDRGADTSCVVDAAGNVAEGPGFNVFAVRDGTVRTPASGVLEGVSRRTVIELCEALAIPLRVAALPAAELADA